MTLADHVPIRDGELIAAVDMGSNSFHMVVARVEHGEPRVIDRLRDTVRMAGTLEDVGSYAGRPCAPPAGSQVAVVQSDVVVTARGSESE